MNMKSLLADSNSRNGPAKLANPATHMTLAALAILAAPLLVLQYK